SAAINDGNEGYRDWLRNDRRKSRTRTRSEGRAEPKCSPLDSRLWLPKSRRSSASSRKRVASETPRELTNAPLPSRQRGREQATVLLKKHPQQKCKPSEEENRPGHSGCRSLQGR